VAGGFLKGRERGVGGSFYPVAPVVAGAVVEPGHHSRDIIHPVKIYFKEFFLAHFRPAAAGGGNRGRKPPDGFPGESQ